MCTLNFREVFFNISKEIADEKSGVKKLEIEEAETNGCSGWKGPNDNECPNDGKFDPNHPACKECEKDALAAMDDNMRDLETDPIL